MQVRVGPYTLTSLCLNTEVAIEAAIQICLRDQDEDFLIELPEESMQIIGEVSNNG